MPNPVSMNNSPEHKAYVITGPTSGIGRATALEVIKHGKVILVGRDREKLNQLQKEVKRKGGHAVSVVCDLSDLASALRRSSRSINANVVFLASGVEDPERKPAKMAGFRGGRYISAEASACGEWKPGGPKMPGADAYATSKQCTLATALEFARKTPRLRFKRGRTGIQSGNRPRARCERLPALPGEVRPLSACSAHQVLEHSKAGCAHDHQAAAQ